MGRADVCALGERLGADHGQHDGLAAIIVIDLIAGLDRHAGAVFHKAALLRQANGAENALTLRLGGVEELLIVLAVGVHFRLFGGAQLVMAVDGLVEQLCFFFFCHVAFSFIKFSNSAFACI